MSRARLRLGIVGCGGITAFAHLPTLCIRDDVDIAYLCDLDVRRAQIAKDRFSLDAARCIDDYRQVLADPSVEAVIVASWPSNHSDIAILAIESGRHALIQKPLTLSVNQADQLMKTAVGSNKNILALPLIRAIPSFQSLASLIRSGQLGTIGFVRIRTTIPGPDDYYADVKEFFHESSEAKPPYRQNAYAMGAGSLADMGPYALSAFYHLFGAGTLCFARVTPFVYDRSALLIIGMGDRTNASDVAPFCSIETGWEQVRGREICTVFGSLATACIESSGNLVILSKDKGERVIDRVDNFVAPLPIAPLDAQTMWIDHILQGKEAGFHDTVESAVWVSKIIAEVLAFLHAPAGVDNE